MKQFTVNIRYFAMSIALITCACSGQTNRTQQEQESQVDYDKLIRRASGADNSISGADRMISNQVEEMAATGQLTIPGLIKLLSDKDPIIRKAAIDSLAKKGPEAVEAVPNLIERMKSEAGSSEGSSARKALILVGSPAVPSLEKELKGSDYLADSLYVGILYEINSAESKKALDKYFKEYPRMREVCPF